MPSRILVSISLAKGKRHLGALLGIGTFVEEYVQRKVADLVSESECLSSIAVTHPHAAYAAYTHGLSSRWTFLARVIPEVGDLLSPLEEAIRHRSLTALTGKTALTDIERDLLALPVRLGGMGISNPIKQASQHHSTSLKVTAPLVALILQQSSNAIPAELAHAQRLAKHEARKVHRQQQANEAEQVIRV